MSLRDRAGFDLSIQASCKRRVESFIDEDLESVMDDSIGKFDPWQEESPQLKKLALAPKRLREEDSCNSSTSQLSVMGDLLAE